MLHSRKRRHDTTRHDGIVVSGKGLEKERLTANRHFPWYGPISSRTGSFRLKFNEDIFRAGKDDIIWQEYSNCSNGKVVLHRIPFRSRKVIKTQANRNGHSDFILDACVVEQHEQVLSCNREPHKSILKKGVTVTHWNQLSILKFAFLPCLLLFLLLLQLSSLLFNFHQCNRTLMNGIGSISDPQGS